METELQYCFEDGWRERASRFSCAINLLPDYVATKISIHDNDVRKFTFSIATGSE